MVVAAAVLVAATTTVREMLRRWTDERKALTL